MAQAFSIQSVEDFLDVTEDETGHVSIRVVTPQAELTIEVEAEDLARALLTASPTFTAELGQFVENTIRAHLLVGA